MLSLSLPVIRRVGHNVPTKATSNGTMCANGSLGTEGPEATETDSSGTGGMRKSLERNGSTQNDTVHLERRYVVEDPACFSLFLSVYVHIYVCYFV